MFTIFVVVKDKVYQMQTNSSVQENVLPIDKNRDISNDVLFPLGKGGLLSIPVKKITGRRKGLSK